MDLSLLFCGTAGSAPTPRRGLPALLLRRGGDRILFDCGEGTQRQLMRFGGLADIDAVFLTHFHADHWLGLPGMLKSFALREREKPLDLFGPAGLRDLIARMAFVQGRLPYELGVTEMEPGDAIEWDDFVIESFNVRHRGTAYGYAVVEADRPGRLDVEKARALGVTHGPDLGRLTRGESVDGVAPEQVVGAARPGRRIVLSGDTAPCEMLTSAAEGADVLVHEATFVEAEHDRAAETRHSTARQAALTAAEADVRLLALVHLSGRYGGREVHDEACETFARTVLPRDGDVIDVPYREKGEPHLVRPEPHAATSARSTS